MVYSLHNVFLIGPASARSYIGVVGNNWLVGWLVNSVFSKTALRIFLFFAWSWGTIKVEKWQSRIFEKNSWFGDIRENVSILAQNQTVWYFSQKRLKRFFLVFGLKLVLNMTFNLNETWFSENFLFGDIWPRNRQNFVVFFQFAGPVNLLLFLGLVRPKSKWQLFQTFGK